MEALSSLLPFAHFESKLTELILVNMFRNDLQLDSRYVYSEVSPPEFIGLTLSGIGFGSWEIEYVQVFSCFLF